MADPGTTYPYITPLRTLAFDFEDTHVFDAKLQDMPQILRDLVGSDETAAYLQDMLQPLFSLTDEQRYNIARIIVDIVLGTLEASRIVQTLSEDLGIPQAAALQIARELDTNIFAPHSIPLFGAGGVADVVSTSETGLSDNPTVDELVAAAQQLAPDERVAYLNRVKENWRVLVLRTQAQLRMEAGSGGTPMGLAQLVVREASRFTLQDWLDLISQEPGIVSDAAVRDALVAFFNTPERIAQAVAAIETPAALRVLEGVLTGTMSRSGPALVQFIRYSPLWVGIRGKSDEEQADLFARVRNLPQETQMTLASPDTAAALASLVRQGAVVREYGPALAKVVLMAALGDVPRDMLPKVLSENLKMGAEAGSQVSALILDTLLKTPVAQQAVAAPQAGPVQTASGSRIIDLRSGPQQP